MDELALGSLAALLVAVLLLLGVVRELAPAGGLTGRGRWLLAAALGTGVLAFAVKLLAILAFALAPSPWIHQTLNPTPVRPFERAPRDPPSAPPGRIRWQSLPTVAPAPFDNPTTAAKVELGRRLFHDRDLSSTREVSCASCHDLQTHAGADGRAVARGIRGQAGRRNAPTVWNAAFQTRLFWDGRAASLEEQALGPITNPIEMGMPSVQAVVLRLSQDADYRRAFASAFGMSGSDEVITPDRIAASLAAFERTLITPDAPYDRFVRGDRHALTPLQLKGMALFESVGCVHCHSGPNFSGASVFDGSAPYRSFPARGVAGLDHLRLNDDSGRASQGSLPGVWRIPSLRNVAVTAPYFHNGSVRELKDAVTIMARAQLGLSVGDASPVVVFETSAQTTPNVIVQSAGVLAESDVVALVAFLRSLTSDRFGSGPTTAPD